MRREVDVPLAGARAERGDGEAAGHLWFRGECGDSVKVAVPVELAAAVAMRGAKVRLVVEVEPEREAQGESAKVAGPWEQSTGLRWVRRDDYAVVAEVRPRVAGQHWFDWGAGTGHAVVAGSTERFEDAKRAADQHLRADGWVLQ